MNTAALDAQNDRKVNRHPFRLDPGTTVRTPAVALVSYTQKLEKLVWILVEVVASLPRISRASSNCSSPEDTVVCSGSSGIVAHLVVTTMADGRALAR